MTNADLIIKESENSGALWLGNYKASIDANFLIDNNISVIINCTKDIPYAFDCNLIEYFRIPVNDSQSEEDMVTMERYFSIVLPFIFNKLITEHKNVLVHCHAGAQRSACVVAAILFIIDRHINGEPEIDTMHKVINYIVKKRPIAFKYGIRINFKKSLESYFEFTF